MTGSSASVPSIKIWELYSDFAIKDLVFFRAGKQMVKWSSNNYEFFSPADIISLTAIDPNDRSADREGPLAIKANIPISVHNLDFYLIAPASTELTSVRDLKAAARFQLVLGGWELGMGAAVDGGLNKAERQSDGSFDYVRDTQAQFVATASGSIYDFSIFGEGLVQRYQSGLYLDDSSYTYGSLNFDHTIVANRDQWLFSGTAGASYNNSDWYLTVMGQYYFNGAGYDDIAGVAKDAAKYLMANYLSYGGTQFSYADLLSMAMGNTGRHYVGLSVSETFAKNSDVTAAAYWLGNLSDGSGFVRPSVSINITDQIILGFYTAVYYGGNNSQFRGIRKALADAGLSSDVAKLFQQPTFKAGLTLELGCGSF